MAQTTYQKIEEYIDLAVAKGYSKDYILGQLYTKKINLGYSLDFERDRSFDEYLRYYPDLKNKVDNALGNSVIPIFLLSDFLKERAYPKPVYLSDLNVHPVVRRYFNALYNLIDDYEVYFARPCNPSEFTTIEEHFGIELPKAFKDFYLITNGASTMIPTFYWYDPIELKYIIEASKTASEFYLSDNPYWEENGFNPPVVFKSLKPMIITNSETGNDLYFDFDTNLEGGMEVVEIGSDVDMTFIARSFEELLNNLSKSMENTESIFIRYFKDNFPYSFEWRIGVYEALNPTLLEK